MHHRTSHWLNLLFLLTFLVAGCQSEIRSDNSKTAFSGPPALETVASKPDLSPAGQPSEAETIAARARQDLLDSMAMNPGSTPVMESSPAGIPATAPLITWNQPGSEPAEIDEPAFTEPIPTLEVESITIPERSVMTLADELARALQKRSLQGQTPMRDLTVMAALAMLDKDRIVHPEAVESLTDDQRAALTALQQWFLAMEHGMQDREATMEMLTEAIHGLQASLNRKSSFGMAQQSLVTRVGGFGDVDEWAFRSEHDEYNFIAHSGQEIILYMELEGFDSRLDTKGQWETATSQQLVIYSDRDGIPVWREGWQTATDLSRTRRSDYFTAQKVKIPTNLSVGKYQLKVRVRDEKTNAESETTIPFVMTAAAMSP